MSWTHFTTEKLDDGSKELRCCKHPEAPLRVREVAPGRTGGAHQRRVVAVCTECNETFRIKLGTFRSGQATSRMRRQ